jgi:hypothetical protein
MRVALAVVVAIAAVVGVLLFVQSRDKSQVGGEASGPGVRVPDQGSEHKQPPPGFRYATDPPATGPHLPAKITRDGVPLTDNQLLHALELGNVAIVYAGHEGQEQALRKLQEDVAGAFDPALADSGQAVILDRRPGVKGVVAVAWGRILRVPSVTDPRVREFADAWLGHGASGQ